MTDVQGRTAFITGGGNGIGLGIARSFTRASVKLVLVRRGYHCTRSREDGTAGEPIKVRAKALLDALPG